MKRITIILIIIFVIKCTFGPDDGRIVIWVTDNPPPQNLDHIYITFNEIRAQNSENNWITLTDTPYTLDILRFANGKGSIICNESIKPGLYTNIFLDIADTNILVIDGVEDTLIIFSSAKAGVDVDYEFTIVKGEVSEFICDIDAFNSIDWTSDPYILNPKFRIFNKSLAGAISGTVKDTSGVGIPNVLSIATIFDDTLSTITDSIGQYTLILEEGTYDISASAEGCNTFDTIYNGVILEADQILTGYNFICK